ncbi:unnamed protein product, partial [Cyprideis torosa]
MDCLVNYSGAVYCIEPDLISVLSSRETPHEQLKGALHVVKGCGSMIRKNWTHLRAVFLALIQANQSDKPSIVDLVDGAFAAIAYEGYDTNAVAVTFPEELNRLLLDPLWQSSPAPSVDKFENESEDLQKFLTRARAHIDKKNKQLLNQYYGINTDLVTLLTTKKLEMNRHFYELGLGFIVRLLRHEQDRPVPIPVLDLILENILTESVDVRKVCLHALSVILEQQKPLRRKVKVNPREMAVRVREKIMAAPIAEDEGVRSGEKKMAAPIAEEDMSYDGPGERWDTAWIQYDPRLWPKSQEEWEEHRYVFKSYVGWYTWSEEEELYDTSQPSLAERDEAEWSEIEKRVFGFVDQDKNFADWIRLFSQEDRKTQDILTHTEQASFWKAFFRAFGLRVMPRFQAHLEAFSTSVEEGHQRCLSVIIGALLDASKHWSYALTDSLYSIILPLLTSALVKI